MAIDPPQIDPHDGIGQKLRLRRNLRQLSLKEVAEKAEVSIALLSQIERGLSAPSLRSLNQICDALEMPIGWLFDRHGSGSVGGASIVVRRQDRRRLDFAGMTKEILSSDSVPQLQLMRFVIHPDGKSGDSPNMHPSGAKAGTILSGQLGLELDGREFILDRGDSFSFPSTTRYRFWCVGSVDCEIFWAVTPALY